MKRPTGILVAIALAATFGLPRHAQAETVVLKDAVIVSDDLIRLGDLFTDVGDKASAAVAYAPQPGRRAVFDAKWLWRVAQAYGLAWRPFSLQDRAIVERDSQVIGIEEIENALRTALVDRGVDPDALINLNHRSLRIYVTGDAIASVGVEDIVFDERSRRFTAILVAPADDPHAQPVRVTGSVHSVTDVPVLANRIGKGERIRENDIKWIKVRADRLQRDAIVELDDLVGKAPKRTMRPGHPLRAADVREPILVQKGAVTTMILKSGSMMLTAQGKALENGGTGETIRIENTKSGSVVEGEVTGPNTVTINLITNIAMIPE